MNRKIVLILVAASLVVVTGSVMALRGGADPQNPGSIYVEAQGLYYDTFKTTDTLPYNGHNGHTFQKLYGTDMGPTCMYGPGDPGYHGGRWWQDLNGNDMMDPEGVDHYFHCPLIPPGYE